MRHWKTKAWILMCLTLGCFGWALAGTDKWAVVKLDDNWVVKFPQRPKVDGLGTGHNTAHHEVDGMSFELTTGRFRGDKKKAEAIVAERVSYHKPKKVEIRKVGKGTAVGVQVDAYTRGRLTHRGLCIWDGATFLDIKVKAAPELKASVANDFLSSLKTPSGVLGSQLLITK